VLPERVPVRVGAACGVLAPAAFVGAWAVGGAVRGDGYDPLHDAISRLAEVGAPTAPLMTAGLVAFGVLVPVWARALGDLLGSAALRRVVTTAGLATLAVAALPVTPDGGTPQDSLHAVAAGTGYLAMAATPLVAAPLLRRRGRTRAAAASTAVGLVSAASLVGTLVAGAVLGEDGPLGSGGLQRLGLTVVDAWHVAAAAAVLVAGSRARSTA
jgi:hypothetical membrane protein